jgi:uncharacterized protein (DUF58 family)
MAVPTRSEAESLAGRLPPLLVAAERVAATVAQGVHGRRRVGQGDSFWQFRPYLPGDPASRIDWRETAKTDKPYIRENEWDAAQSVWLWADRSPSMHWASSRTLPQKAERAALLALALAALLQRGGERVAALVPGHRPSAGRQALDRLAGTLAAETGSLPAVLPLPRHAELVLIGDFLGPLDETRRLVSAYLDRGVDGHLVQLLDPAEETLPYAGRIRFEGLEGEASLLVSRADAIRERYQERLAEHRAGLGEIARSAGWSMMRHHTDRPAAEALLALWAHLAQAGRG